MGWDFDSDRFEEEDVDKFVFYPTPRNGDSVAVTPQTPNNFLDLSKLFGGLVSDSLYTVSASVTLKNGLQSDAANLPTDAIYFDDEPPGIDSFKVWDADSSPLPASPGFTNNDVVAYKLAASSDVDSLLFNGDVSDATMTAFLDSGAVSLALEGNEIKNIVAAVRDSAGNWSFETSTTIKRIPQEISVDILADTIGVATVDTTVVETVVVLCKHPQYLRHIFTRSDTMEVTPPLDCSSQGGLYRCILEAPFKVFEDKYNTVSVSDSAGSLSNTDTLHFDIQTPPHIDVVLFDATEYDAQSKEADSLATDEYNETQKIIVRLRLLQGAWQEYRLAFTKSGLDSAVWAPLKADTTVFNAVMSLDAEPPCEIVVYAMARNKLGDTSEIASASIIHDVTPPSLTELRATLDRREGVVAIDYKANDKGDCQSGVAGIVLRDSVAATQAVKWFYMPVWSESQSLTPIDVDGLHYLMAFVVDSADVDQRTGPLEGGNLASLKDLWREENGGKLDHPGNSLEKSFVWTPSGSQSAGNIAYNFPNPFNPENGAEITSFYLPVDEDMSVDLRIFDLFGHLVREETGVLYTAVVDAGSGGALQWDGRNENGEIVASGAYLAIITLENGESLKPIKIGVLRKN